MSKSERLAEACKALAKCVTGPSTLSVSETDFHNLHAWFDKQCRVKCELGVDVLEFNQTLRVVSGG